MKKSFRIQKLVTIIYMLMLIACFIYALAFMTDYANLFGFKTAENRPISKFHDEMLQPYNKTILWVTIIGVASLILIQMLEVRKKICDKIVLIVMSITVAFPVGFSIFSLIKLPQIMKTYHSLDYSKMPLENTALPSDYEYIFKDTTFLLGIILSIVCLIIAFSFIYIIYFNNKKFIKSNKVGEENE